jgi:hypothetical protein
MRMSEKISLSLHTQQTTVPSSLCALEPYLSYRLPTNCKCCTLRRRLRVLRLKSKTPGRRAFFYTRPTRKARVWMNQVPRYLATRHYLAPKT